MIGFLLIEDKETVMEGIGVFNGQSWVLAIELGYICFRQSRIAEGVDFDVHTIFLFSQ